MQIVWTARARAARAAAIAYLERGSPSAASRQLQVISARIEQLGRHPFLGRVGLLPGTRELVIGRTHFIAIYRVRPYEEVIEILHFLHTSRRRSKD